MSSIRLHIIHRKDMFDFLGSMSIHLFAGEDRGFSIVGHLSRGAAKALDKIIDGSCFLYGGLATYQEIIGEE